MARDSRSRSPRGFGRITQIAASAMKSVHRASVITHRASVITLSATRVATAANTNDMRYIGKLLHDASASLGGLVRKVMQQLSSRPDILSSAEIREELRNLLADVHPRETDIIKNQLSDGFGVDYAFDRVLKAGTIGEVSRISKNGVFYALKTVDLQQKTLYDQDFAILDGFAACLEKAIGLFPWFPLVRGVIDKVRDFTTDAHPGIMEEFDLKTEKRNLENMGAALCRLCNSQAWTALGLGATVVAVPEVEQVSSSGDALVMKFVPGQNLHDLLKSGELQDDHSTREQIAYALCVTFIYSLLVEGELHADLHAGNVLIEQSESLKVALVDCGCVVHAAPDQRSHARELLRLPLAHGRRDGVGAKAKVLFQALGVQQKMDFDEAGEEHYRALLDMFDIPLGAAGDQDIAHVLELTERLQLPPWMLRWQKATFVLVATLSMLGMSDTELLDRKFLEIYDALRL